MSTRSQAMLVRIKPYNPKRGHVLRKYTHLPTGKRFEENAGWYKVDAGLANYLKGVHQIASDPDSQFAFDVCTEAEAKRIDEREKKSKERKDPNEANDLTTSDLHRRLDASQSTGSPVEERRQARAARSQRADQRAERTRSVT